MISDKILITGGAGFIGSNLAEKLIEISHKVVLIDNFDTYYNPEIKKKNISILIKKNVPFYKLDILDFKNLERVFQIEKPKKIIHLAARPGVIPSLKETTFYEQVNVSGTINLLELSKKYKIRQFIFASSSSVYGNTNNIPFSEDDLSIFPVSPYGVTKKNAENFCHLYAKLYNIPTTCLRLFTVYGPRQRPEMAIHKFVRQMTNNKEIVIFGNGKSLRDYTYITDIIDGIIKSIEKPFKFEIINLGESHPIKLIELIKIIEKVLNKKTKIKFKNEIKYEMKITYADVSKAKKLLDYTPIVSIKEGIEKFYKWYTTMFL